DRPISRHVFAECSSEQSRMINISNPDRRVIPSQSELFTVPDDVTFLNCANMSPQLRVVTTAGLDSVRSKASPWEIASSDWFSGPERLRELAATIVGTDADSIALIPSVSYGIATAAANIKIESGQSIV